MRRMVTSCTKGEPEPLVFLRSKPYSCSSEPRTSHPRPQTALHLRLT
jgi:hypothetical protein